MHSYRTLYRTPQYVSNSQYMTMTITGDQPPVTDGVTGGLPPVTTITAIVRQQH